MEVISATEDSKTLMVWVYVAHPQGRTFWCIICNISLHEGHGPTDLSCIYSTLKFPCFHENQYQTYQVVTFDQHLWSKAYNMVESLPELQLVVICLGGLHTFLVSIGHLMGVSCLQELFKVVYSSNTVEHMFSGKTCS